MNLQNYEPDPNTGCWLWAGSINNSGYGRVGDGLYAHRVLYERSVGPIPLGTELDHLCRTRSCVNPAHLEPVTHRENLRRGLAIRTHCPHGHEYTDANTYRSPRGERRCRECHRQESRKRARELSYIDRLDA